MDKIIEVIQGVLGHTREGVVYFLIGAIVIALGKAGYWPDNIDKGGLSGAKLLCALGVGVVAADALSWLRARNARRKADRELRP